MSKTKSFYELLNVDKTATKKEIRKAYKKLALELHPDRNDGKTTEKFTEVLTAYETLYDDDKRAEYDMMSSTGGGGYGYDNVQLYSVFKDYFKTKLPKYTDLMDVLINTFYTSEDDLQHDVNNFDFGGIAHNIFGRRESEFNIPLYKNKVSMLLFDNTSYETVHVDIMDIYLNKIFKINIKNKAGEDVEYNIPVHNKQVIVINGIEKTHIDIVLNPQDKYEIHGHDLLANVVIDTYIDSGEPICFKHFDKEIKFTPNGEQLYCIQQGGLPFVIEGVLMYGNLYIQTKKLNP